MTEPQTTTQHKLTRIQYLKDKIYDLHTAHRLWIDANPECKLEEDVVATLLINVIDQSHAEILKIEQEDLGYEDKSDTSTGTYIGAYKGTGIQHDPNPKSLNYELSSSVKLAPKSFTQFVKDLDEVTNDIKGYNKSVFQAYIESLVDILEDMNKQESDGNVSVPIAESALADTQPKPAYQARRCRYYKDNQGLSSEIPTSTPVADTTKSTAYPNNQEKSDTIGKSDNHVDLAAEIFNTLLSLFNSPKSK